MEKEKPCIAVRFWRWWHDIPEKPEDITKRASEIILLGMVLTAINVAGIAIQILLCWLRLR